jgi:hypothetical protein
MGIESTKDNHLGMGETDQKSIMEQLIVPFSNVSSHSMEEFIYSGKEKIPFKDRHPIFQALMLGEFVNY